jgi:hypothetical protein
MVFFFLFFELSLSASYIVEYETSIHPDCNWPQFETLKRTFRSFQTIKEALNFINLKGYTGEMGPEPFKAFVALHKAEPVQLQLEKVGSHVEIQQVPVEKTVDDFVWKLKD